MDINTAKLLIRLVDNVSSDNTSRSALNTFNVVKVSAEQALIYATNGHIMFKTLVDDIGLVEILGKNESLNPSLESFEIFKATFKAWMKLNKSIQFYPHAKFDKNTYGSFPNCEKVLKQFEMRTPENKIDSYSIGINAEYIFKLSKAFGDEKIKMSLDLSSNLNAIHVTSAINWNHYGLIMPLRV